MTSPQLNPSMARLLDVLDPDAVVSELYGDRGSEVYDAMTRGDGSEVREVLRIGRHARGRILELACGSGRLTLPLARLGRETVALDSSPRMLEMLAETASRIGLDTIHPVCADMSAFELDGLFGVIVLATTSITLLSASQRRAMLLAVRAHLAPDGVFVVSVHSTGAYPIGETTQLVSVPGMESDVYLLHEQVGAGVDHRDVSVLHMQRRESSQMTEAFVSRVELLDEAQLRGELDAAGLQVRASTSVRLTDASRNLSMLECVR